MVLSYPAGGAYLLQTSLGIGTPVNLFNLCLQCTSERGLSQREWVPGPVVRILGSPWLWLNVWVSLSEVLHLLCSVSSSVKWGLAASAL